MTKRDAISLFGSVSKLAAELGVTSQAISLWPDGELPKRRANEVLGAAVRAGIWQPVTTDDTKTGDQAA